MGTLNVTNARKNLYRLIDEVNESHAPVTITGKERSAVLVSEEDWNAIGCGSFATTRGRG